MLINYIKVFFQWEPQIGPVLYIQTRNNNYGFCLCHHLKERSIPFFGFEKLFCSRCLGIVLGAFFVGILSLFIHTIFTDNWLLGVFLILPLILDGFSQLFGIRESNNYVRLITGFLFSIGLGMII